MTDNKLTHFDASGNAVMVDVSEQAVVSGTVKKGDVLGVARIAGIMAT